MNRLLLLCSILLFCPFVHANPVTGSSELANIALSPTWQKLLVYGDNGQSYITSDSFFFSENGAADPLAELLATLTAFATPVDPANPDMHAQCKFPARYQWLKQQITTHNFDIEELSCPKFNQFNKQQNISSISVIFATGFLANPASYYGHLLLKLNTENVPTKHTDLQDTAINFGADVPADENMALYVIKGIIGQYDASFTQQKYFYHAGNYRESELRDLWEYELALEQPDITLLLGHIWELLDADYRYYFFNRNCAFHMGDLLQLVLTSKLADSQRLWMTPQSIMQNLSNVDFQGQPLVKTITYHPSRQSRLYQRFSFLNQQQKDVVHNIVNKPEDLAGFDLSGFEIAEQHAIVDTLIDYFQFMRKEAAGAGDINNTHYKQAVLLRYQLAPGPAVVDFDSASQPHLGRKPSYTSVQIVHNSAVESYGQIQLRPAYYDALDAEEGHVRFSALSMGELVLGFSDSRFFLKDLSLVKIESIRANLTGLPGDRNYSWYLDVGAAQRQAGCDNCEAFKVNTGIGYGFGAATKLNVTGFVGGGYLGETLNSKDSYLATKLIATWYASQRLSSRLELEQRFYSDGRKDLLTKLNGRYALNTDLDFRVAIIKDDSVTEVALALGWYW
ncbi:DUF4105 domain-containing protein [Arsukibacterium sp.]|uniref:Lnb N-terminal periplasmic domain-containing protein n=1 Tax=Arsukibacterium sp. TaxID=1977258 RepID=UPI001BD6B9F6|nr:DUF4105 domain-containing protein [Arsukibacterium sp.]